MLSIGRRLIVEDRFKFRGWDGKDMIYYNLLQPNESHLGWIIHWRGETFDEVMQCTGYKDMDGTLIFEGDRDEVGNFIEWVGGGWCLNGDRPLSMMADFFKIAGNKYEGLK